MGVFPPFLTDKKIGSAQNFLPPFLTDKTNWELLEISPAVSYGQKKTKKL
jgi:hypothetical protein